jgi:NADH:ubiquinone oxidoreductase subunit E
MLVGQQQRLQDDIRGLVERFGRQRSSLIPVLEVYGVTSFYAFLRQESRGRFVFRLCQTISCDLSGKSRVARQLENDLGIRFGETTADGRFSLEWASCLGMCDQGPALLVNDRIYSQVTPEQVHAIIDECTRTFGAHARQAAHSQAS